MTGNRIKKIKRFNEITSIIVKYGFSDLFPKMLKNAPEKFKLKNKELINNSTHNERIRLCLQELGTTFIKFGQMLSNRPDLFSEDLLNELQKLQEHVPPFDKKISVNIIETELKHPIAAIFKEFEEEPIAAASIGQVHKATLINGEVVIVKVQRPNIKEKIDIDTDIMLELARMTEKNFKSVKSIHPTDIILSFKKNIQKETDFKNELNNIKRFNHNFKNDNTTHTPKTYDEYSSSLILCMEFINGFSPLDKEALKINNINLEAIAKNGTNLMMKQIFEFGFFHADPHAGNIKIETSGKVVFIDFGMMGYLSQKNRLLLSEILVNLLNQDTEKLTKNIIKLTKSSITKYNSLENDIENFIENYLYNNLEDINIGELSNSIVKIIIKNKLDIPEQFYLLGKSLGTIEGVVRSVYPQFNMFKEVKPYIVKLIKKRYNPVEKIKSIFFNSYDSLDYLSKLPKDIKELIERISLGETQININHKGLENLTKSINNFSNKIAIALILSGLIVASSLVTLSKIPPYWNEIPIIGMLGFIISGILSLMLIIQIIKNNR